MHIPKLFHSPILKAFQLNMYVYIYNFFFLQGQSCRYLNSNSTQSLWLLNDIKQLTELRRSSILLYYSSKMTTLWILHIFRHWIVFAVRYDGTSQKNWKTDWFLFVLFFWTTTYFSTSIKWNWHFCLSFSDWFFTHWVACNKTWKRKSFSF